MSSFVLCKGVIDKNNIGITENKIERTVINELQKPKIHYKGGGGKSESAPAKLYVVVHR